MATLIDNSMPKMANGDAVKVDPKPKSPEIFVNGVEITLEAIQQEVQNHEAETPKDAVLNAARALVIRELLLQKADALGLSAEPMEDAQGRRETDEDAKVRQLLEQEVDVPRAGEEECQRYFDQHQDKFSSDTIYEARHILLAGALEDPVARRKGMVKAGQIIESLNKAPDRFGEFAREFSQCPSAKEGGNLGQLTKGQTVPEFETVLFELEEGQMSPTPVPTPFGYHIIQLDRIIEGRQLPFDHVKSKIAAFLEASSWSRAVAQYIGILAGEAEIKGIQIDGADSPLVQ
ncbi:peptidylprolyl isomerase [Maritalea porphyrae]|uniref:peptidylprolyl isomerase n=1 Tax=Maritalea porphyrae TaxID=880732 RepID=UPI0022AFE132|nr:peptidylprolyl isomerase [Maritalea porphyrae]MCZ4273520.1 peptidylprolyl isomerase [Maritalea porphyrae]